MSPTIYGVDEQGNLLQAPYTVTQPSSSLFIDIDPSTGNTPVYQGPHLGAANTHSGVPDNWSSLCVLQAGDPLNPTGRDVFRFEETDGTYNDPTRGGLLLEANSASASEWNTAGRQATEVPCFSSAFAPGAHFFLRQSFWIPSPFTSNVGHYTIHEFMGFPLHLPTFQIGVFFGTSIDLLLLSCDLWNQPGNPGSSVNFTDYSFGRTPMDCWHDIVLEVQCNDLRMGNAVGMVNGGTSSQWIPNNNGWYRAWYVKQGAGSSFAQGSLLPLKSSGGNSTGVNPNYPNGVPAIDAQGNVPPAGAIGANWIQPQMNAPLTGTGWNFGYWTFGYTDNGSLAASGTKGYLKHFAGATKGSFILADVLA